MRKLMLALAVVVAIPVGAMAHPDIEVTPLEYDFCDVQVGDSSTVIVTLTNVGEHPLTVQIIAREVGSSDDFSITFAPSVPFEIYPYHWPSSSADLEITFEPSASGSVSAGLKIVSNDPDEGTVTVLLSGTGIESEPPPEQQIQEILDFIDESVETGDLSGSGPGNSANGRLNALINMIESAGDLIEDGDYEAAYNQLQTVYKKCDGETPPPDFVEGDAREELAGMILALMADVLELM